MDCVKHDGGAGFDDSDGMNSQPRGVTQGEVEGGHDSILNPTSGEQPTAARSMPCPGDL